MRREKGKCLRVLTQQMLLKLWNIKSSISLLLAPSGVITGDQTKCEIISYEKRVIIGYHIGWKRSISSICIQNRRFVTPTVLRRTFPFGSWTPGRREDPLLQTDLLTAWNTQTESLSGSTQFWKKTSWMPFIVNTVVQSCDISYFVTASRCQFSFKFYPHVFWFLPIGLIQCS